MEARAMELPIAFYNQCHFKSLLQFTDTRYKKNFVCITLLLYVLTVFSPFATEATNTIKHGEVLRDGETIISSKQSFVLGFFSPPNSTLRYLGIWYNNMSVQTVMWIANRDSPVSGTNGSLTINGNAMLLAGNGNPLWSSKISVPSTNSTATLTDSGNLILTNSVDSENILWQSFETPTDTYVAGMRLQLDAPNGENKIFKSWRSARDPSIGDYAMGIDTRGTPQIVTWQGSKRLYRSGHWNGLIFLGIPSMRNFPLSGFKFYKEEDGGMYVTYTATTGDSTRFYIWSNGSIGQLTRMQGMMDWKLIQMHPAIECEKYNRCGSFGVCSGTNPAVCDCINGFEPKDKDQWNRGNWSGGCIRRTLLQCRSDGFFTVQKVKLPDFADLVAAENIVECKHKCLKNCTCKAYAFVIGIQCMIWNVDIVDVQHFTGDGDTLYVRVNSSELGGTPTIPTAIKIVIAISTAVCAGTLWLLWRFRVKVIAKLPALDRMGGRHVKIDLPMYTFSRVAAATNNFSCENKLGEGGFGPVYKGTLPGGQEIAVKRLSRNSGQGMEEFKNECILIANLQHRNLVRLLGCSIGGEEKLLLYEYMHNKSLDYFLFDRKKQAQLDWSKRFMIIEGIARGLIYLHRDSRLKIIHRDLKASNILLDENMKPKISDFGMARMFGGEQSEANTNRVVGTYGYMSPEYVLRGQFSVKSDVYSFGVLVLEIISGQKNATFCSREDTSLIQYTWNLWNDGRPLELVDPVITDSCNEDEVLRCIHVGMLCVQDCAAHRPTLPSVVSMLESGGTNLQEPRLPAFSSLAEMVYNNEDDNSTSKNNVSLTELIAR